MRRDRWSERLLRWLSGCWIRACVRPGNYSMDSRKPSWYPYRSIYLAINMCECASIIKVTYPSSCQSPSIVWF